MLSTIHRRARFEISDHILQKLKKFFGSLFIQLVWYLVKQLFHLSVGESGGCLPSRELFISTSVNNC